MGKGEKAVDATAALNLWLQERLLRSKKVSRIHNMILTLLLFGSCSASLCLFTMMLLINPGGLLNLSWRVHKDSVVCSSNYRTSVCRLTGDVRVSSRNMMVALFTSNRKTEDGKLIGRIRPYTRKWEKSMKFIGEVSMVRLQPASHPNDMKCDVKHNVPAVIFSTGGYTGNVFHDFNDGLLPLFITSHMYRGEVVLMILAFQDWWPKKYSQIVKQLSHYPPIDFERTEQVHCFPEVVLGLEHHGDLLVDPALMPHNRTVRSFQQMLDKAFDQGKRGSPKNPSMQRQPKMVLMVRNDTRAIVNQVETLELAKRIGFEVQTLTPTGRSRLSDIYQLLHSADVLLGVHGAALTHFLFMRPNSTFIQVVPLGLDKEAESCFGEAARQAGMRYVRYRVLPAESTLSEQYGLNHTVVTNPKEIRSRGWQELKKYYLEGQNIRLSLPRLEQVLRDAYGDAAARLSI